MSMAISQDVTNDQETVVKINAQLWEGSESCPQPFFSL